MARPSVVLNVSMNKLMEKKHEQQTADRGRVRAIVRLRKWKVSVPFGKRKLF